MYAPTNAAERGGEALAGAAGRPRSDRAGSPPRLAGGGAGRGSAARPGACGLASMTSPLHYGQLLFKNIYLNEWT